MKLTLGIREIKITINLKFERIFKLYFMEKDYRKK